MTGTKILLLMALLAYGALGGVTMQIWQQRTWHQRPANMFGNPEAWLNYWLPKVIAAELFALVGAAAFSISAFAAGHLFAGPFGSSIWLSLIIGLPGIAILFAMIDAAAIIHARRVGRRRRQIGHIEPNDPRPPA